MERAEIKEKLSEFIRHELLHNPSYPLEEDEPLITGGLIDSRSLVQISVFIEEKIGVYIPDTDFTVEKMDTLAMMVNRVMEEL